MTWSMVTVIEWAITSWTSRAIRWRSSVAAFSASPISAALRSAIDSTSRRITAPIVTPMTIAPIQIEEAVELVVDEQPSDGQREAGEDHRDHDPS